MGIKARTLVFALALLIGASMLVEGQVIFQRGRSTLTSPSIIGQLTLPNYTVSMDEYLRISWVSNAVEIQTDKSAAGTYRDLYIGTTGAGTALNFRTANTTRWFIDSTGNFRANGAYPLVAGSFVSPLVTVTTLTTASNQTYTAASLVGGLLLRNPNGGARSDVTPTAAQFKGVLPGAMIGQGIYFTIRNTAGAAETITVNMGANVTASGTMGIAQNNSKQFLLVFTNVTAASEAATLYSLGTVVH